VEVLDGLVLFDPREPALAERVGVEVLGGANGRVHAAFAALALPEALGLFEGRSYPTPPALWQVDVRRGARRRLAALAPLGLRLRLLCPELDDALYELLDCFARLTGTPVVAAAPFQLWSHELVVRPDRALTCLLVSSLDALLLGDRLLGKVHATDADENLLPFVPRLSRRAAVVSRGGPDGRILIRVQPLRGSTPGRVLRLRPQAEPLLELLDGRRSVERIVAELAARSGRRGEEVQGRVCTFLRTLWRQGTVRFDEAPEPAVPEVRAG
jgi:hypothetical protein